MLSDTPSQPLLQAHDVCVAIDSTEILHRLNFSVQSGEFLAIRGSNGSGKTTLLRTILNILPVSAGRLELFGKNAAKLNSQDWQKIGYAPQHVTATSIMPATALETVASGLLSGNHLWKPRNWKARAMLALEKVGLERRANESLQTFSGGQQQRVLIARAMVKQPQLLILDEPFSGIDSSSRNEIVGLLAKMHEDHTTVITVLHDTYELAPFIDTTIFLDQGRIEKIMHPGCKSVAAPSNPT